MKKILAILALVAGLTSVHAQQLMSSTVCAANTSSNLLAVAAIIDNLTILNATTNTAIIKFYDTSNATTSVVRQAYTSYTTISTNFDVVFTNQANVLVTNTFVGVYTAPVAHTAVTNSRTSPLTLVVPAGTVLNKDVKLQVVQGLAAVPDQAVTIVTTYRLPY